MVLLRFGTWINDALVSNAETAGLCAFVALLARVVTRV